MILREPFFISSRLMPAVKVGGATVQLECSDYDHEDRMVYRTIIDFADGTTHEDTDIRSGVGGGSVRDGFGALFSFLSAAAESRQFRERTGMAGENEELFPEHVVSWAAANSDEIACLACEVEECAGMVEDDGWTP